MATFITQTNNNLLSYVEAHDAYYDSYEAYQPEVAPLMRINMMRPEAHVVIASRLSCGDCIRNLPKLAQIAKNLPGWSWDVYERDQDYPRSLSLNIVAVPTIIVYDQMNGRELGRIVEDPTSGSLEKDLLEIIQKSR